jgi:hypothetical protein
MTRAELEAILAGTKTEREEAKAARKKYYDQIGTLLTHKFGLDNAEVEKIREDHSWDGMSCACGGGWLFGHLGGCPEKPIDHVSALCTALLENMDRVEELEFGLAAAVQIAGEAAEEWDKAPEGMRAGKILLALAGHRPRYRPDTDAIHATLAARNSLGGSNER